MSDYLFECHDKCMKSDPECLRWYQIMFAIPYHTHSSLSQPCLIKLCYMISKV